MVYYPVPWLSVNLCARRENEGGLSTIVPLTILYRLVKAPLSFLMRIFSIFLPQYGLCFNNNLEEDWHQFWRTTMMRGGQWWESACFRWWSHDDLHMMIVEESAFSLTICSSDEILCADQTIVAFNIQHSTFVEWTKNAERWVVVGVSTFQMVVS
ncbi:hypothetical protein HELRODRAFT_180644 [Helobdella robusta]|uniref:Uncharacterized protein n=1 Tax=Helobdella robusta TaxID=6412 RepID=T1FG44_HELRO|nr:hypothetical protein HELRODRAFT_180644 [Helobdella robusta]ESN93776.1 hypothetical protein HELRODRAFT_180644 [Helobdella robusta]